MSEYNSNYEIAQAISQRIGVEPIPFDSVYEICLAIYNELGGEPAQFDSVYEILLGILPLAEGGGSGKAIEEVDELPEASENKEKFYRLSSDDNVYVSELKSRTETTTNRLPDAQQIDKAYLYDDGDICYYKGSYKVILTDGEIDGYGWYKTYDGGIWYMYIAEDNAVNINETTVLYSTNNDEMVDIEIDNVNKVITIPEMTVADLKLYYSLILGESAIIPIPATYNAPEANQIGNATLVDNSNIENGLYTGEQITFEDVDTGEQITGYKWEDLDDSGYCFATDKPASQIYFAYIEDSETPGEYLLYTDVKVWYVDLSDDTAEQDGFRNANGLYIPQLNAPDADQIGHAKIYDNVNNAYYVCTESVNVHCSGGVEVPAYLWHSEGPDPVEWTNIMSNAPSTCYSSIPTGVVCNEDIYYDDENDTWYCVEDAEMFSMWLSEHIDDEGQYEYSDLVKYQRTVVTEVWDWEKVATESEVSEISEELDSKANQIDFVIPVDPQTQSYDWSVLDTFNTTGFYKGIAHADYMGMSLDFAAIQLSVVAASTLIIQTIGFYTFMNGVDNIQMGSRQSTDGGTTWTTMTESMLPSINDTTSVSSAVANKTTYSRTKIDSLISALDQRLTAIGG